MMNMHLLARRARGLFFMLTLMAILTAPARADIYSDLANSTNTALGDALITTKQPYTGGVAQSLHDKLTQILNVEDFGAVGDGVTDDTAALQAALGAAAPNGTVYLSQYGRYRVTDNLFMPMGVTLKGAGFTCGTDGIYDSTYFNSRGSVILLASTAVIEMASASSLSDIYIFRYGITFPAPNASAFAGTAISVNYYGGANKCDVILKNLLIIGFNTAVNGVGCPRLMADNVNFDCLNGFNIGYTGDPIRFNNCHGWPFATVSYSPFSEAINRRTGVAYNFTTNADAGKVQNCFAFGYATGFAATNCNGIQFLNCGADDFYTGTTSTGFLFQGASSHAGMFDCQSVAHQTGVAINLSEGMAVQINDCLIGANTTNNISILEGGANVVGGLMYSAQRVAMLSSATARLHMSGVYVEAQINEIINNALNSPYVQIDNGNYFQDAGVSVYNGGGGYPSVASATTVDLPKSGELVQVTGSTNIFGLTGGWPGRRVTLLFTGSPTLSDAAGMQMNGNFSATANSTITFIFTGASQCYEVSRSKN